MTDESQDFMPEFMTDEEFLETAAADFLDIGHNPVEAAALQAAELLKDPEKKAQGLKTLNFLQARNSVLAACLLGMHRLEQAKSPDELDEARRLLVLAAEKDFPPAFRPLALCLLSLHGPAVLEDAGAVLWRGIVAGSLSSLYEIIERRMGDGLPLSAEEQNDLAWLLCSRAREDDWRALELLLRFDEKSRALPQDVRDELLDLLLARAGKGQVEAMELMADKCLDYRMPGWQTMARHWSRRAWEAGSLEGGLRLALILRGDGPAGRDEVLRILEECAARDSLLAMTILGRELLETDRARALDLLHDAALRGSPEEYLANLQKDIWTGGQAEDSLARMKAPEIRDLPQTSLLLARLALAGLDGEPPSRERRDAAMARIRSLAGEGSPEACALLAEILVFGLFGQEEDPEAAGQWIDMARARREPRAMALRALTLLNGTGETANREEAAEALISAACSLGDLLAASCRLSELVHAAREESITMSDLRNEGGALLRQIWQLAPETGDTAAMLALVPLFTDPDLAGQTEALVEELAELPFPGLARTGVFCLTLGLLRATLACGEPKAREILAGLTAEQPDLAPLFPGI